MKTLKLQLLTACMFACATAFGQANQGTAPAPGAPQQDPMYQANNNSVAADGIKSRAAATSDAYIMQSGADHQYANVDQTGRNSADIYQGMNNPGSSNTNNATVTQRQTDNSENATKNQAYIAQDGSNSTASQNQNGTNLKATILQGLGDQNSATQTQTGQGNTAYVKQDGNRSTTEQTQNGDNGIASIHQGTGTDNFAQQNQDAGSSGNRAYVDQSTGNGSFNVSYQTQSGTANYGAVTQSGVNGYSSTSQAGAANAAIVTQH